MNEYNSLNDVSLAGFESGDTEIWYGVHLPNSKVKPGIDAYNGWKPDSVDDIPKTHILLGSVGESNLERIFQMMQGENWSPQGEANHLIRSLGLSHTSMSVGDIVRIEDLAWICHPIGWEPIHSGTQ